MSILQDVLIILMVVIDFSIGLLYLIRAKKIVTWLVAWVTPLVKGSLDAPYTKTERQISIWTLRCVGALLTIAGIVALFYFFQNMV